MCRLEDQHVIIVAKLYDATLAVKSICETYGMDAYNSP